MNEWINQGMKMQLYITNKEQTKQTNIRSQWRERDDAILKTILTLSIMEAPTYK